MTSRGTRRWIIPKGWPKRGKSPYETAAKEAFEEAGVVGKVSRRPIGSYPYDKILETGDKASCRVDVFALRVTRQRKRWPEKLNAKLDGIRQLKPLALFGTRICVGSFGNSRKAQN